MPYRGCYKGIHQANTHNRYETLRKDGTERLEMQKDLPLPPVLTEEEKAEIEKEKAKATKAKGKGKKGKGKEAEAEEEEEVEGNEVEKWEKTAVEAGKFKR